MEEILRGFCSNHGVESLVLRHFSVVPADLKGETGEIHDPEIRIASIVLNAVPESFTRWSYADRTTGLQARPAFGIMRMSGILRKCITFGWNGFQRRMETAFSAFVQVAASRFARLLSMRRS